MDKRTECLIINTLRRRLRRRRRIFNVVK